MFIPTVNQKMGHCFSVTFVREEQRQFIKTLTVVFNISHVKVSKPPY